VARRSTWLIDMGDGTWAVSCMACRIALYRGPKAGAERAARGPPGARPPPLPRLWHPSGPAAARHHQPQRRSRPGSGPPRVHQPPPDT